MVKRPTIPTFTGQVSTNQINTAFFNIKDAFDNTLSRDGSTPNAMNADLDMNNNDVMNVKDINILGKIYANGEEWVAPNGPGDGGQEGLVNEFYLTSYLNAEDLAFALEGDTASQDATRVTNAIRACHDDVMAWWKISPNRSARVIYPPAFLAINDELFTESFAQSLWDMGFTSRDRRIYFIGNGVTFKLKGFNGIAAVRTSGRYAGITHPVPKAVFRWESDNAYANAPNFEGGITIFGEENYLTDPIGIFSYRSNLVFWDKITINRLANHGVFIFNMFNSRVSNMEISDSGFQPTEYGGNGWLPDTVKFSNVGPIVTATSSVFNSTHVGKKFAVAVAGASQGSVRSMFWSTIQSVDSATQITLVDTPDIDVSDVFGSFESVNASTTAGSNLITLSANLAAGANLVGRYVTIAGVGRNNINLNNGNLTSVITAHSGNTITLAEAARVARSNVPICFGAGLTISGLGDAPDEDRTDATQFFGLQVENGGWMPVGGAVSAIISDTSSVDFGPGCKFHGAASNQNNFGGNFANLIINRSVNLRLADNTFTHGGHSTKFGKIIFSGGEVSAQLTGGDVGYPDGTETAWIYNIMTSAPSIGDIRYGLSKISPLLSTQTNIRLGPFATTAPFFQHNSSAVSREGNEETPELPIRLSGTPTGSAVVSSVTDTSSGRLMTVGYGGDTGAVTPPTVTNLNALTGMHRRVIASAGAVGAPDGVNAWVVDNIWTGTKDVQLAYRSQLNSTPSTMVRHNNTTAGTFTTWVDLAAAGGGGGSVSWGGILGTLADQTDLVAALNAKAAAAHTHAFSDLTGIPNTVAGYGITDAVDTTSLQTIGGTKTFSTLANNYSIGTGSGTTGYSSGGTVSGATKTVNVGTGGLNGSTTNINLGSSTTGALGTLTLNSPTVVFGTNVTNVTFPDTIFTLADNAAPTKQAKFELSGISTGVTRTYTFPDANGTLALNSLFGASVAGLVPASGGGTSNFLRADGTWAAPAGGGGGGGSASTVLSLTADPASPANGDIWYRSDISQLKFRSGGESLIIDRQLDNYSALPPVGQFISNCLTASATAGVTTAANRFDLMPWRAPRDILIDQLAFRVSAFTSAVDFKIVIYEADARGNPSTLFYESAVIPVTAIATLTDTLATAIRFSQGKFYWLGLRCSAGGVTYQVLPVNAAPYIQGGTTVNSNSRAVLRKTLTFGTPAPTTYSADYEADINPQAPPAIYMRVAE